MKRYVQHWIDASCNLWALERSQRIKAMQDTESQNSRVRSQTPNWWHSEGRGNSFSRVTLLFVIYAAKCGKHRNINPFRRRKTAHAVIWLITLLTKQMFGTRRAITIVNGLAPVSLPDWNLIPWELSSQVVTFPGFARSYGWLRHCGRLLTFWAFGIRAAPSPVA